MNRNQERKYSMYMAVSAFLAGVLASIIAKMPDMDNAIAKLIAYIQDIEETSEAQETNRIGYAQGKEITKEELVNIIFVLAGQVKSFAVNTNNPVLKNEVSYPISKLFAMADTGLLITAGRIIAKATQNIAELADYGVTAPLLNDIQLIVNNYTIKISQPRNATSLQVEETNQLEILFSKTDKLLKEKMDTLVIIVKNSDPDFYNVYKSNRKIIGPGYQKIPLRCKVKDQEGIPIPKVTAIIDGINKKFITTANGGFYVKSIPNGTHTITFTRAGFETQSTTFPITKGTRTNLNIVMKRL